MTGEFALGVNHLEARRGGGGGGRESAGLKAGEATVERRGLEAWRNPGDEKYSTADSSDTQALLYTLKEVFHFQLLYECHLEEGMFCSKCASTLQNTHGCVEKTSTHLKSATTLERTASDNKAIAMHIGDPLICQIWVSHQIIFAKGHLCVSVKQIKKWALC